uniref:Lipase_3 domain-containing protein n=1 Tax=Macrostomum lignano TaxID=282301 RepID=A0A1I8I303_9PLAT
VSYCWVLFSVTVKNMWTACISVFRCLATFKPIGFRRWLTRRFQLCGFGVLLLVAAAAGPGTFAAWRLAAGGSERFLVDVMLPLTRTPQTYLPVPLILLASGVTAAQLAVARGNRPGEANDASGAANQQAVSTSSVSCLTATRIVLVLAISFSIFELPGAIFITFELHKQLPDWMVPVSDLLVTVDSACSFFVFYAFSANFRRQVGQLLNCGRAPAPPSAGLGGVGVGGGSGLGLSLIHGAAGGDLSSLRLLGSQNIPESPARGLPDLAGSSDASEDERQRQELRLHYQRLSQSYLQGIWASPRTFRLALATTGSWCCGVAQEDPVVPVFTVKIGLPGLGDVSGRNLGNQPLNMAPNQQFSIAASLANGTGLGCSRTCIAVRAVTIPVAAAGLLLSCLWLLILIGKYRRNPEPVDIGLILMQLAFTNFCLAALCYVAFELALLKSGHTRWASFKHNVSFANLWMMCTCLFRFMAISRPMKFRRWLTCRIQLCSFAVLLLVASAVVFGAFAGWRLTAGGSEQFLVNTMLPLTRTTQTYLPVPLIVLISALTVAELAAARANRPGDNIASLSPSSTHSSGADANTNAIPATEDPVAAAAAAAAACENAALAAAECFNASVMSSEDEDGSSTKAMTDVTDAIEAARAAAAANQYSAKAAKADWLVPVDDLLVTCHGAVHFAIFGAFSANFRGQLRQLLRCQANRDAPKSGRDGQPRQQENRPLVGTKTRPS